MRLRARPGAWPRPRPPRQRACPAHARPPGPGRATRPARGVHALPAQRGAGPHRLRPLRLNRRLSAAAAAPRVATWCGATTSRTSPATARTSSQRIRRAGYLKRASLLVRRREPRLGRRAPPLLAARHRAPPGWRARRTARTSSTRASARSASAWSLGSPQAERVRPAGRHLRHELRLRALARAVPPCPVCARLQAPDRGAGTAGSRPAAAPVSRPGGAGIAGPDPAEPAPGPAGPERCRPDRPSPAGPGPRRTRRVRETPAGAPGRSEARLLQAARRLARPGRERLRVVLAGEQVQHGALHRPWMSGHAPVSSASSGSTPPIVSPPSKRSNTRGSM